jgi:hypothetical protein
LGPSTRGPIRREDDAMGKWTALAFAGAVVGMTLPPAYAADFP